MKASFKKALAVLLAAALLPLLPSCSDLSKLEQRMKKSEIALDLSGCKLEKETDTHGWMGDGESLAVLDCAGAEASMREQTKGWADLPLSINLQSVICDGTDSLRNELPTITDGKWAFYDRYPDSEPFDRHSDEKLAAFSRAKNFTLVLYDAENAKLYYYELDT